MMATATNEYRLNIHAGGKNYSLDYQQAFRFGYGMARTRKFKEAAKVFESLAGTGDPGGLAAIMLAYCKAGLKDYKACNDQLCNVFPNNAAEKVEQLQAAFVYVSLGMWPDAAAELTAVARAYPDLPLACLVLGDAFAYQKKRTKALACWRMAIVRDRGNGAVATVARQLVSSQTKSHKGH